MQIEIQEELFSHINSTIQDNIGQLLSSTTILLGIAQRNVENWPPGLGEAQENLSNAIIYLRELSKGMNNDWLKKFNLIENLRSEIARKQLTSQGSVTVQSAVNQLPLTSEVQIVLFRVIKDVLTITGEAEKTGDVEINVIIEGDIKIEISDSRGGKEVAQDEELEKINWRIALISGKIRWIKNQYQRNQLEIEIPIQRNKMKTSIGIVDDHQLFLKSLRMLVDSFPDFEVTLEALNGDALTKQLESKPDIPDILLIDVNMPIMNGIATAAWVSARYPATRLVALSMDDDDVTIIKMITSGCCAYLMKGIHPNELERALTEVAEKGYYNGDLSNINYRRLIKSSQEKSITFSDREIAFLELASTDMTYKQIAAEMCLSERTIDGYREVLFQKLNVQSRVGMVLAALRKSLISLNKHDVGMK